MSKFLFLGIARFGVSSYPVRWHFTFSLALDFKFILVSRSVAKESISLDGDKEAGRTLGVLMKLGKTDVICEDNDINNNIVFGELC